MTISQLNLSLESLGVEAVEQPADLLDDFKQQITGVRFNTHTIGRGTTWTREKKDAAAVATGSDKKGTRGGVNYWPAGAVEPRIQAVEAVVRSARAFWVSQTIVYPDDPNTRLIRRDQVEAFASRMAEFEAELAYRKAQLVEAWPAIAQRVVDRNPGVVTLEMLPLSECYRPGWSWRWDEVQLPASGLPPCIAEQHAARLQAQLDQAYQAMLAGVVAELSDAITGLRDKLEESATSKGKKLMPGRLEALLNFFDGFAQLPCVPETLTAMVDRAKKVAAGFPDPDQLKHTDASWRLAAAQKLDGLLEHIVPWIEDGDRAVKV